MGSIMEEKIQHSSLDNGDQRKGINGTHSSNSIPLRKTQSANSSSLLTKTNSSFAPITAHYSLNKTLHAAFYQLCEKKNHRTALAIGMQFCRVALFDIPLHSYYHSPKYHEQKIESVHLVLELSDLLPSVLNLAVLDADRQGIPFDSDGKKDEVLMLQNIARNHYHELLHPTNEPPLEQDHLPDRGMSYSRSFMQHSFIKKESLCDIDRYDWDCGIHNLSLQICPVSEDQIMEEIPSEKKESDEAVPSRFGESEDDRNEHSMQINRNQSEPILIGISSYRNYEPNENAFTHKSKESLQFDADLERALYLSGIEIERRNEIHHLNDEQYRNLKPVGSDIVEFNTLAQMYKDDFIELRNSSHILVTYVDTYQGRLRGSLNGCTVIAPLLAIHHICSDEAICSRNSILMEGRSKSEHSSSKDEPPLRTTSSSLTVDGGLHDDIVRVVIDVQAPKVLTQVRNVLNLQHDSLIIPSDVHDYLIEQNILHRQQFVDVLGGNILDDDHISAFITKFDETSRHSSEFDPKDLCSCRKVSATFFFHEHVVSIHKVTRHIYTSIRDENDSLKKKKSKKIFRKLRKKKNQSKTGDDKNDEDAITTVDEEHVWFELIDSLPGAKMLYYDKDTDVFEDYVSSTARIRCKNIRSLHALLRWYAFTKFTPDDEKFIDSYEFDALNMEFDPRVFQAFLFADK